MVGFKDSDDFFKTEEGIIFYINNNLNLDFCRPTEDVTQIDNSITFIGRPSAVIYKEDKKVVSMLIIKTIFTEEYISSTNPYDSHVLQLSFDLYLAGIDIGYICLCLMSHEKEAVTEFNSMLKKKYINTKKNYLLQLLPVFSEVRSLPISYQILNYGSNNINQDVPLYLGEIKIDFEQIGGVIKNYADGGNEHLCKSPELTKKEQKLARKAIKKYRNN